MQNNNNSANTEASDNNINANEYWRDRDREYAIDVVKMSGSIAFLTSFISMVATQEPISSFMLWISAGMVMHNRMMPTHDEHNAIRFVPNITDFSGIASAAGATTGVLCANIAQQQISEMFNTNKGANQDRGF